MSEQEIDPEQESSMTAVLHPKTDILDVHSLILEAAEALPPLSSTMVGLAQLVADPHSDIDNVSDLVRQDPSLTGQLLREANSAASAPSREIVLVDHAVMRLGLARVLAVACAASVGPRVDVELHSYGLRAGALWGHLRVSSYVAEAAYRLLNGQVGPEIVTSALLHDIGKVVVHPALHRGHFARLAPYLPVDEVERELVDVDHAESGAELLDMWKIPPSITEAVRLHHTPAYTSGDPATVLALASKVAEQIAPADLEHAAPAEPEVPLLAEALGLDLDEVFAKSRELLVDVGMLPDSDQPEADRPEFDRRES